MDTGTLDFNTLTLLVAIVGSTMGSTLTLVTLMIKQSNRHEDSIKALDTKFTGKLDAMGGDISDARERLARIEGHLVAPEGFRMRGLDPPASKEPSPENDPDNHRAHGQREAG